MLFGASFLSGCADENFSAPERSDEVTLNFAVAETPVVATRAAIKDNNIEDLTLLVFDGADKLIYQQKLDNKGAVDDNTKFTATVKLSDITATGSLKFYALTSCNSKLTGLSNNTSSLSDLQAIEDNIDGTSLSMSAKVESSLENLQKKTFTLHRNVAKWDIKLPESIVGKQMENVNFSLKSFQVVNALPTTTVTAGADGSFGKGTAATKTGNYDEFVYVAPKESASDMCVLIKASYNGTDCWYKVDMTSGFKVVANHRYQVQIVDVKAPGYATAQEAKDSPAVNMEAVVVDHKPEIYSLSSTGTHTLGTPESLSANNTTAQEFDLLIKTVCKETSNCNTSDPKVEVLEGSDWITVKGTATVTTSNDAGSNPAGKFYNQKLELKPLVGGDYREGLVKVTWGTLTRTVRIEQTGVFDGSALGKFTLNLSNNPNDNTASYDYFDTFLKNALGVDEDAMCGVVRNQGLHFPIGLQSAATEPNVAGTKTVYSYTLSAIKADYQGSYEISLKAGSKFAGKLKVGGTAISSSAKATGTFSSSTSLTFSVDDLGWDYIAEPEALVVKVTKDGKTTEFTYDLYHTGFFFKPGADTYRVDGTTQSKYYYYEVVKSQAASRDIYWLDRNIGATAAGMYIENANGANDMAGATSPFVDGSQGGLYAISKESGKTLDQDIVPPGFRIPTATEFTTLTSSPSFVTKTFTAPGNNKTYWSAYFLNNAAGRNIYFPKNRMKLAGGSKAGDGNSGYYWTRTEAVGSSGEEIGKWFQAVKIAGGSASVIRYRAYDKNNASNRAGMSVRGVRNTSVSETVKTYKLKVTGYTHVYLYMIDESGARVALNTWPGDQVTTYSGSTGSNSYDYDFNAYSEYPNVYVILNQLDGNTIKKSWFNGTGTATPGSNGFDVKSGSSTPWQTRINVPNGDASGGDYNKYVVYWKKDLGSYDQLMVNDNGTKYVSAKVYSSNSNYYYAEYNTTSTSIEFKLYSKSTKYTYNKEGGGYFSVSKAASGDTYFTINAYNIYKVGKP